MKRLLLLLVAVATCLPAVAKDPVIRLVPFEGPITPISADRILKSIDDAEAEQDDLVLIELDTPGGMVTSMEKIVKRMLAAEVPIVVWVGPAGAHAASAGLFLLVSADVAAMAPGTRTGASATVVMGGENRADDVMLKKSNEDLAALIRSIADRRDRNPEACEEAVFAAKAYEERVALEKGLIDLIAADRDSLLKELDGRAVQKFDGTEVTLATNNATFVETTFSFQHRFIEFLATPALAAILFFLGVLGIYVEFTNPGGIFPGVAGALCILLFALTAQVLPVSAIGVLLIALAVLMFILEVKITSYGLLTLGGTISLVVGAIMLIDGPIPELRVAPALVVPLALTLAALCSGAMWMAVRAQRAQVATGIEGMPEELGVVTVPLTPNGKVRVHGEIWNATVSERDQTVEEGDRVRVLRVDGMRLIVQPETASID